MNEAYDNRFLAARKKYITREFSNLNEMQQEAVLTTEGPLLLLAGAGSGKTTVLVNRIANIIRYGTGYESKNIPFDLSEGNIAELEMALRLPTEQLEKYMTKYAENPCPAWAVRCMRGMTWQAR